MIVSPIDATNPEVLAMAIDANDDEDITAGDKVSKINKSINDM